MGYKLQEWEESLSSDLEGIEAVKRSRPGALLPVIPDREHWEEFSSAVRLEWHYWKRDLERYPACLIVLYGGIAFYEYGENTFWPHFGKLVGSASIPQNQQTELNNSFFHASERYGLRVFNKSVGRTAHYYVSVAVSQIGIPLSLWDGFLEVCEWASWLDNWDSLSDESWLQSVTKRTGSRIRLRRFLTDNRDTATTLIRELLDARNILTANPQWTVTELSRACFMRAEYFEEVPETAEFLRPTNPDSLIPDRAQLIWDEQKSRIVLYLPGVQQSKLPATWRLEKLEQSASSRPDELILNSLAFRPDLNVKLESSSGTGSQKLRGIQPWGLFSGGRLVNPDREYLPLHNYVLVADTQLSDISREGFEEEDCPVNQKYELEDGTHCFVTHLCPTEKFAEVTLGNNSQRTTIRFRRNSKLEARFFVGSGAAAANFARLTGNELKIENWPILSLAIPRGYYKENLIGLNEKFMVSINGRPAFGRWEPREVRLDDGRDCYVWNWSTHPLNCEKAKSGTAKSFKQLADFFHIPSSHGKMLLSIQAPGFSKEYLIYKDDPKAGMEKCWEQLPGAFLPWFLLCQTEEGMKWEELLFARDIIAPGIRLSAYLLRKYEKEGFLIQKGVRWKITESRATVIDTKKEKCRLDYCGDPSVLWRFYRWMSRPRAARITLPNIQVVNNRGEVPYLTMSWDPHLYDEIVQGLKHMNVRVGSSLWNH